MEPLRNKSGAKRLLICPNAYKGSFTADEAARAIENGWKRADHPGSALRWEVERLPLADGGDGTLETLIAATGGAVVEETVRGPLGTPIRAVWGRLGGKRRDTAVIEMAKASGLALLRPEEYDPLRATTFGTGQLMRAAMDAGCRKIVIGIGGSATTDGGAGMAQALGARLLDSSGQELPAGGAALLNLTAIDMRSFCVQGLEITAACDVNNPLCGPHGAAAVYGPQKGAGRAEIEALDRALAHYASVLKTQVGVDVADLPGAGAAGGLGAGLTAFCRASLRSGLDMVMDVIDFDARLKGCDLVLTGEGRLDGQTTRGKVVAGVAMRAKALNIPVIALAGGGGAENGGRSLRTRFDSRVLYCRPSDGRVRGDAGCRTIADRDCRPHPSRVGGAFVARVLRVPAAQTADSVSEARAMNCSEKT